MTKFLLGLVLGFAGTYCLVVDWSVPVHSSHDESFIQGRLTSVRFCEDDDAAVIASSSGRLRIECADSRKVPLSIVGKNVSLSGWDFVSPRFRPPFMIWIHGE